MWSPRHLVGALAAATVLTGCSSGPAVFDPAKEEPCAFLTIEDLEDLRMRAQVAEPRDCMYAPKIGSIIGIEQGRVGFRQVPAAQMAMEEKLIETTDFGPRIGYRNRSRIADGGRASCILVGRIDDATSLMVYFLIDKSNVVAELEPQHDPCKYLMDTHRRIADRLGVPED